MIDWFIAYIGTIAKKSSLIIKVDWFRIDEKSRKTTIFKFFNILQIYAVFLESRGLNYVRMHGGRGEILIRKW